MTLIDSARLFISDLVLECIDNKVTLELSAGEGVDMDGVVCSGYFDSEEPRLEMAIGTPFEEWFPIMLHEYSHMRQWIERREWFDKNDFDIQLTEWITGAIELSREEIDRYVADAMELEGDCEQRVVELIKARNIPIDIEEYAQKSMAYVNGYIAMGKFRQWTAPFKAPYRQPEVWKLFPKVIDLSWRPGEEHMAAYAKYCFVECQL
jgi:hypothetical protein